MCLKCHQMRPLSMFGLRRMADGSIRNQPWCRGCRSGAGAEKPRRREQEEAAGRRSTPASTSESVAEAAPVAQRPIDAGRCPPQIAAALAGGLAKVEFPRVTRGLPCARESRGRPRYREAAPFFFDAHPSAGFRDRTTPLFARRLTAIKRIHPP